ncbi:MAG TPA: DUF5317 domain-containing protein [Anaerolineales bacterium]|nr:DUF5317 domain-containing protein [Anaerolineales bacterium]
MILLIALAAGLAAGVVLARWRGHSYQPPELRVSWLAFLAFLPQFILLYLPYFRIRVSDQVSAVCLLASLLIFLGFAWVNRGLPGMSILLIGLALNLTVMAANGGFMPISPQTAGQLVPEGALLDFQSGDRFGIKDIYLPPLDTRFEWLADRFLTPAWFSYRAAFSLGDVFIAIGAFGLLAWTGLPEKNNRGISQ